MLQQQYRRRSRSLSPIMLIARSVYLWIFLCFLILPIRAASAEDVKAPSQSDLYRCCKLLQLTDDDCDCILRVSSELNDDNLAARLSLGFARRDDTYLKSIAKETENSEFYEGFHGLTLQDKRALLLERVNQFDLGLRRTCDINLKNVVK